MRIASMTNRISFLVLLPFVIFIALFAGSATYLYFMMRINLDNIEIHNMQRSLEQSNAIIHMRERNVGKGIDMMNQLLVTQFSEAAAAGDVETMESEIKTIALHSESVGYALIGMDGQMVLSSYDSYDSAPLMALVDHAQECDSIFYASSDFIGNSILNYAAGLIKGVDGEKLGLLMLFSNSVSLETGFDLSKRDWTANMYAFHGRKCVASTDFGIDEVTAAVDTSILNCVYNDKSTWIGRTSFMGNDIFASCTPITDHKGEPIAFLMSRFESAEAEDVLTRIQVSMPTIIGLIVILFALLLNRLRRRVMKPLNDLVLYVNQIATGDLSCTMKRSKACDEVTILASSVSEMEHMLRSVLEPINKASVRLMASAKQLTKASDVLSASANKQAASLEEISSSMEEMGANIQQNTENSINTNKLTEEINKMAEKLGKAAGTSYDAIRNISENISDINDLVAQTNILALNASVEAARAGEHGQGFGVVAKEVGRLAEQTHDTANGINQTAASSISEAEEAFEQVKELVPKIDKVTALVKEITTASIEQNSGVSQVNTAITDLNRVTQQNAANADEIAVCTQDMKDIIVNLNKSVAIFKL